MITCSNDPCPVCKGSATLFQTVRYGVQKVRCPSCSYLMQSPSGKWEPRPLNGRREQRERDRGKYLLLQPLKGKGRTIHRYTQKGAKPATYLAY